MTLKERKTTPEDSAAAASAKRGKSLKAFLSLSHDNEDDDDDDAERLNEKELSIEKSFGGEWKIL